MAEHAEYCPYNYSDCTCDSEVRLLRAEIDRLKEAQRAVVYAWTIEGPSPAYHRAAKSRLTRDWPRLATAITELVRS